jgi:hypothetical protein
LEPARNFATIIRLMSTIILYVPMYRSSIANLESHLRLLAQLFRTFSGNLFTHISEILSRLVSTSNILYSSEDPHPRLLCLPVAHNINNDQIMSFRIVVKSFTKRTASVAVASSSPAKRIWLDKSITSSFTPLRCYLSTESSSTKPESVTLGENIPAPPMVYISGEEMTHYASELFVDQWIKPYFDTSTWEVYDLSCKNRDQTDDKVLHDAVAAGARVGAIFKEPTITPSAIQVKEMGLSKAFGSPNGAMRRGWNGITISRDTIHIKGMELGYKNQVLFERHAVGGEYGAGWNQVGEGTLLTTYLPKDGSPPFVVDKRDLTDDNNVVVVYHNPYDNVKELAHLFFQRCLDAKLTPYVVTKKTVFKWQEGFWEAMKEVFDADYKVMGFCWLKERLLCTFSSDTVSIVPFRT